MIPLIAVLILFHCAECCFFKKGIPKCPRNDEDIIPDEVAEYLARQAYRHGFEKCSYIRHPYILPAHSYGM
nr:unnamed protein product [Spirometra erinaceieuropaei]